MESKFGTVGLKDVLHGAIITVAGSVFSGVSLFIAKGSIPSKKELIELALTALCVGIAYIIKKVFTNSDGVALKPENREVAP